LLWSGQLPLQMLASLKRAAVGYALAAAVCIPLGICMGLFDHMRRALEVTVNMLRPMPPPVVIPAAMLFFGLDNAMKIFVIGFACAWPILLNTLDGVRNIDRGLWHTARTFRLPQHKLLWHIILPASALHIMTGLRVSLPIMLILVVISEIVGSSDGIGYFILDAQRRFRVTQMYAGMLALALAGYLLNQLFTLVHRSLLAWHWGMTRRTALE
jgi:ABC-type nitrate/sulfonate/bicarbonate transport system permease component